MRLTSLRSRLLIAPVLAGAALLTQSASGQAHKETAIQAMRLQVYGVGSYMHPQYGSVQTGGGFGVGGAAGFTLHHVHRLEPAIDVRYTYGTNSALTETFLGGGARLTYHMARFHPYGDFMVGTGNINFKQVDPTYPNYRHDDSTVYMFGGGLDYDLTQTFALRVDFQQQKWQLAVGNVPFYPTHASVGLRYQFHFRNKYGPE